MGRIGGLKENGEKRGGRIFITDHDGGIITVVQRGIQGKINPHLILPHFLLSLSNLLV